METKEFIKRIEKELSEIEFDFEKEEIDNIREIIADGELEEISQVNNTILGRILEDEDVLKEIEKRTIKESSGNAFD